MGDKIEERGLRAKIREFLSQKYKNVTTHKVLRIMDGFPTIEEFCAANTSEWLAKYRGARPNSQFDLGKICTKAIEDVIAFVREDRHKAEMERIEQERAENEAKAAQEAARIRTEQEEERRNPKFTLGELKSLVSFMELCDITSIDLKKIKNFLSMIDAKIKET